MKDFQRIQVVDSHTGGEPTRVVIAGGPDLGSGSMKERRAIFQERFDDFRSCVVNEPRGSDVMVGALMCEPADHSCAAGVIFFNNVGCLNMCGHGTIGVGVTLAHLGRLSSNRFRLDTPVGVVALEIEGAHKVTFDNVPSFLYAADVAIDVPCHGKVVGDVAWGGNWFFLAKESGIPLELANVEKLTDYTWRIRQTLEERGITGKDGQHIDHIEVFGPPRASSANSRNFVLCPGKAYDRSPCGTGTSAKLACLYARGLLKEEEIWRQESIVGSVFEGSVRIEDGKIIPRITGSAYVNAEATLLLDPDDPFRMGIRA